MSQVVLIVFIYCCNSQLGEVLFMITGLHDKKLCLSKYFGLMDELLNRIYSLLRNVISNIYSSEVNDRIYQANGSSLGAHYHKSG
jgi:hypothetical protein